MNKDSRILHGLLKYFLNDNQKYVHQFLQSYIVVSKIYLIKILTKKELANTTVPYAKPETKDIKNRWNNIFGVTKDNQNDFDGTEKKYMQDTMQDTKDLNNYVRTHVLSKMSKGDFCYVNINYSNMPKPSFEEHVSKEYKYEQTYHILNDYDLSLISSYLLDFLCHKTNIRFRIKWLFNNKPISNAEFAQKVHVSPKEINALTTGQKKVGRISLDDADKLNKFYCMIVNRQNIDKSSVPSKDFIKKTYKNW